MSEIYNWQDIVDKNGDFIPHQEQYPTQKTGNFITRHPILLATAITAALYWSGALGDNQKGSQYRPVKPTDGSIFLGFTKKGSEFMTPVRESALFYCGKKLTPLQNDTDFKKNIEVLPQDTFVHITCEGTDERTPIDWPEATNHTPPQEQSPYNYNTPPYPENYPDTPKPRYPDSAPSEPA